MVRGANSLPTGRRPLALICSLLSLLLLLGLAAPAAAQDPTPEPTSDDPIYVVVAGDTLFAIAQRFDSTVEAIVAANNLDNPRLIHAGQRLIIPTARPELVPSQEVQSDERIHPVRPGEMLPSLAFRYGTTVWDLGAANELDPLGVLSPGQELLIPTPDAPTAATPHFPEVSAGPAPLAQGQTVLVEVAAGADLELTASFLGQDLDFAPGDGAYWALTGVGALTPPGAYPLTLAITETETGDRLSMHQTLTVAGGGFPTYNIVVPADRQNLLAPSVVEQERVLVNSVFAGVSDEQLWTGTFGYPLAGELRVTAPFGQRRSYNSGPVSSYHSGQDLGADKGVPVLAPMDGIVALAQPLDVRGQVVILDHGLGVLTGFWHLSQINVQEGQSVAQGEVVGLVGSTGLSTGPHLHWEMRVRGVPVDPFQWTRQAFP